VLTYFLMTALGAALLIAVGKVIYNVRFEGDPVSVVLASALGSLSFFATGYVLGGLAPNGRVAQTAGMILAHPMMFLSGATVPPGEPPRERASARELHPPHPCRHADAWCLGRRCPRRARPGVDRAGTLLVIGTAVSARVFRSD